MTPINTILKFSLAVGALILVLIITNFSLFSVFILEGKVFYVFLVLTLLTKFNYKIVLSLALAIFFASMLLYLFNLKDLADLYATIGFKVIIIAVAAATFSFLADRKALLEKA